MRIDLRQVPFSRRGTFLAISRLPAGDRRPEGLYLRTVRGGDDKFGEAFRIELTDASGRSLPFDEEASPERLALTTPGYGSAEICFPDGRTARFRARGVGIRLSFVSASSYDYAYETDAGRWEVNSFTHECRFLLSPIAGCALRTYVPWDKVKSSRIVAEFAAPVPGADCEFAVGEFRAVPEAPRTKWEPFDAAAARVRDEFRDWTARCPSSLLPRWTAARELAAYITWSCLVPAEGCLTRPAMYMSKNWMTNIWSWDHCFNAMALIGHDPQLAWDQFMLFFDRQDESGLLPDFVNDKYELWNCNKPPIHGWTLSWMMKRSGWIEEKQLNEVYGPLAKWTRWWFEHRDGDGDGMPQYNHGNDSGWDNSTVFGSGIPVESPDLAAFLVLQAETLADIAERLGRPDEAAEWKALADATLDGMLRHFWREGRFVACKSGTHEVPEGDSLLLYVPIILGKRLPEPVRTSLLQGLKEDGRFLTANGWATESVRSPFYSPDGYWRGPIWAPSTMLIVEGAAAAGDAELAREAAHRFCAMASRSGMAENFDALTGEGLRDRAFTWTSSVYLILAGEYASD